MRKWKKIKVMFNSDPYNSIVLDTFWFSINLNEKKEEEEHLIFLEKLEMFLKDNNITFHKKVISSFKPFVKICKKNKKYIKKSIEKNSMKNKTFLIKYKNKVIYISQFDHKKYTNALEKIARINYFGFLEKFVENWNKYQSEFKIKVNEEERKKIAILKKDKYIDYFTNYYNNLK